MQEVNFTSLGTLQKTFMGVEEFGGSGCPNFACVEGGGAVPRFCQSSKGGCPDFAKY